MGRINVMELFAGVGGFRIGLERADVELFKTVWANQYEPSKVAQNAFNCYTERFGKEGVSNEDIAKVDEMSFQDKDINLIVGGFPCQDYSVARNSKGKQGIDGKKGVLFWDIVRLVEEIKPRHVLLENVDRLLITPANQRGRDFGIMLKVLHDLGYLVEWRILDASHYGGSQRRIRVFINAVRDDTEYAKERINEDVYDVLSQTGFFASKFPIRKSLFKLQPKGIPLLGDLVKLSDTFTGDFKNAGLVRNGHAYTIKTVPVREGYPSLGDILEDDVEDKYYLTDEQIEKFAYLRGKKEIERETSDGFKYLYKEGAMSPIDYLDKPSRTILTGEGGVSRTSHIIEDDKGKRFLTPLECERLNNFPDNWTVSLDDRMRYFCMGNALDVNLIERMGERIKEIDTGK